MMLKWFGRVERMGSERLTKRVCMSEVREACAERGLGLEHAKGMRMVHENK